MPVIAAIDGTTLGGGLEIALACDLRVAADSAKMGAIETSLSIFPGAGGSQRLPRIIGPSRAKQMIYTACIINGTEAEKIGLVNYIVPQDDSGEAAYKKSLEVAKEIIANGPLGNSSAKAAINEGLQTDINTGMKIEAAHFANLIHSNDLEEGFKALLEKRKPIYENK